MRILLLILVLGLDAFGEPHTVYIRGGHTTDDRDPTFRPVVALLRRYEVKDPATGEWVEGRAICTGTVINRVCVLSAAHCAAGPGERNLSIEVFNGPSIEKRKPFGRIQKVELRDPKAKEIEPANDIALLLLDTVQDADRSLYTANLHDAAHSTLLAGAETKIVGYGAVNSNYDVATKEWKHVGAGEKRDGIMKVVEPINGKQALITLAPGDQNHSAGPGDSGGPVLHSVNDQITLFGVSGYMNSKKLVNASKNSYISVAFHRDWLLENMKAFGCDDQRARGYALRDFLLDKFGSLEGAAKKMSDRRLEQPDEEKLQELLLGAAGYSGGPFSHLRLAKPVVQPDGALRIAYRAYYSDNPQVDVNAGIRQGKAPNDRPKGEILLPAPRLSRENLTEPVYREKR